MISFRLLNSFLLINDIVCSERRQKQNYAKERNYPIKVSFTRYARCGVDKVFDGENLRECAKYVGGFCIGMVENLANFKMRRCVGALLRFNGLEKSLDLMRRNFKWLIRT